MNIFNVLTITTVMALSLSLSWAKEICPDEEQSSLSEYIADVPVEAVRKVYFSGVINSSSISRLIKQIEKAKAKNEGLKQEIIITLDSPGGDVNEAVRAIDYIRELSLDPLIDIHTKVSSYNTCESACTILYTAGVKRFADGSSKFGFHSPKFQTGNLNGMTRKEVEELYRRIWLNYIGMVDHTASATLHSKKYLMDEDMKYLSGSELNTGYVTDLI